MLVSIRAQLTKLVLAVLLPGLLGALCLIGAGGLMVSGTDPWPVVQAVGVAALLLLLIALTVALIAARRIAHAVKQLQRAAGELEAGLQVRHLPTGLMECDDVSNALSNASVVMHRTRAELEQQVAEALARAAQAEQRIAQNQRIETVGRLTGGVAHDFNNLLGIITNNAHLMQHHPSMRSEMQAPLAATLRAVERGSQLMQHVLRVARHQPHQRQHVHLTRYLPELLELMRSFIGRHIRLTAQVAPDTLPVPVDIGELELALVSLTLNARDAMPRGGELRLSARNAEPAELQNLPNVPPTGSYVLITVSDDGAGVAPDEASHVFEPFFTTEAMGQGSGRGLSQVLGFCLQSGGTVRMDSTPGLGTTVTLLLPTDNAPQPLANAPPRKQLPRVDGLHVLLVDDDDELARATAALLAAHGAQVLHAALPAQALALLADGHKVDVVLSDITMPGGIDGLALARLLRRQWPQLPVVLNTGYSAVSEAAQAEFQLLQKPYSEVQLLQALQSAAAGRRDTSEV